MPMPTARTLSDDPRDALALARLLLDASAERAEIIGVDGRLLAINKAGRNQLNADGCATVGCSWQMLWSACDRDLVELALARGRTGIATSFEATSAAGSRSSCWQVHLAPLRNEHGLPDVLLAISHELTPALATTDRAPQPALSTELLRLALADAKLGTWHWDLRTDRIVWSERSFEMFGLEPQRELDYDTFRAAVDPRDLKMVEEGLAQALRDKSDYEAEFRIVWTDQSVHWVTARGRIACDVDGTPLYMEGVSQDVTARREAERDLRERELRFRLLADAISSLVWQSGADGELTYVNQRWIEYFGRTSLTRAEWAELVHPDDRAQLEALWSARQDGDAGQNYLRFRRHDGQYLWFSCRVEPMRDAEGNFTRLVGTASEIEHLKQTKAALRESRARLDTALRAAGMGTWVWQLDNDLVQLDPSLTQLLGIPSSSGVDRTMTQWLESVHQDDLPAVRAAVARARSRDADLDLECRARRADGQAIWVSVKGRIERSAPGEAHQMFGACVDVTHHKQLEEELLQAQKMEAIGQLAGGVAHDFNNLLTVIVGHISLISSTAGLPISVVQSLSEIQTAAERAAGLTAQLLAFGRRQTMQRQAIDLNEVVLSACQMLERLIDANVSVACDMDSAPLALRADQNMLTQVLLNLALNARDAMPAGGQLSIRTRRVILDPQSLDRLSEDHSGRWACLTVADTGEGISSEVLPHIFEPFYTTKEVGKGTGLGLATVYGIVKQHHGIVAVDSTPGRGTRFDVFVPLLAQETSEVAPLNATQARSGRNELVLLVEDNAAVRGAISAVLEQQNYRLLVADDGLQALELFARRGAEIDLVLSDVVLPRGVSGPELALRLRRHNPGLKMILCSGYSADKVDHCLDALPGVLFLQKPYPIAELLASMRNLLEDDDASAAAVPIH